MRNKKYYDKVRQMMFTKDVTEHEFKSIQLDIAIKLMNEYAEENLIMKKISIGDKIPFDRYVDELRITCNTYDLHINIEGNYIDSKEKIVGEDILKIRKKFFDRQMAKLFSQYSYDIEFQTWIDELFPLFCEILDTSPTRRYNVIIDDFDSQKIIKIVMAVASGKLKKDRGMGRYLRFRHYNNIFINRIVKFDMGYKLQVDNINVIEYKLLVLSAMRFANQKLATEFFDKIMQWFEGL